jgi:hypothetical protein
MPTRNGVTDAGSSGILDDPDHWRDRAEKMRVLAEDAKDPARLRRPCAGSRQITTVSRTTPSSVVSDCPPLILPTELSR